MSTETGSILGGESVYCINRGQLEEAQRIAEQDPESAPRLQAELTRLQSELTRNERAALAFLLIERLRTTVPDK